MKKFFDIIYKISKKRNKFKLISTPFSFRAAFRVPNRLNIVFSSVKNNFFLVTCNKILPKVFLTVSSGHFGVKNKLKISKKVLPFFIKKLEKSIINRDFSEFLIICKNQDLLKNHLIKLLILVFFKTKVTFNHLDSISKIKYLIVKTTTGKPFNGCKRKR